MSTRAAMRAAILGTALLALVPAYAGAVQAPAPDPIPLDQLLGIGSVVGGETPTWSPDGGAILFASSLGGSGLMTISPDGGFPVRVPVDAGTAGHFLASQLPAWSPDGRWISYISAKSGAQELWLWSTADGREARLTTLGARINSYTWSPDGQWIAFAGDRHGHYDIWKVRVATGEVVRLTRDERYEVFPTWTPDSRRIVYVRLDDRWVDHDVLAMGADGGRPQLVVRDTGFFDYRAGGTFGYPRVSPDGGQVLFRSQRSGWINYWVVPLDGGEPRPIAPEGADQSGAVWSPDGEHIAFTSNTDGTHALRVVPARGGAARTLVDPGVGMAQDPAWSPDGTRISYRLGTPTDPGDLHVVRLADGRSARLTRSLPAGNLEDRLVAPEKVRYGTEDGLTISAYLYRPPDIPRGTRVPALLWIHGGPTSQFHDSFQQEVQYFVQRGYAVLLPNIRGSSGYGRAFEEANDGCWGHCDLEDVRAGVRYLEGLGYVDPGRVGITGTSYGGCMSIAAITFAPGLFGAAVPRSGYADWLHFMDEQELRHVKLLEHEFGTVAESREVYVRNSPIHFVDRVQTPTLLIHGEGFFPESEASALYESALERNYKVVRRSVFQGENYYVRGRENRKRMLGEMLAFFEQFLGGGTGAVEAP